VINVKGTITQSGVTVKGHIGEAAHTPKPWHVTGANIRSDNHRDGTGALLFVAGEMFHNYTPDPGEQNANLTLAAAAPELLAALKDVAEQIAAYDYLHGENSCSIDDAPALAAIRDLYPCYDPTSNIYPVTKATGGERKEL
jgi:hypothetical protein